MKQVNYTDTDGKEYIVSLPDDVDNSEAAKGIILGPLVDLSILHWPKETEVKLHNELFVRSLYTLKEVMHRRQDLQGAIQSALKLDAANIINAYKAYEEGENT